MSDTDELGLFMVAFLVSGRSFSTVFGVLGMTALALAACLHTFALGFVGFSPTLVGWLLVRLLLLVCRKNAFLLHQGSESFEGFLEVAIDLDLQWLGLNGFSGSYLIAADSCCCGWLRLTSPRALVEVSSISSFMVSHC